MYAVIQFTESDGGTLSVINKEWLTPRKCEVYWPPVKGSKAFERILDTASPDEKWKLYGVQRIFCETDSISNAKQKLKLAEVTSDLQTEDDTELCDRPKRKLIRTHRYISSDEEDGINDKHRRPPPLKKQFVDLMQAQDPKLESSSSAPLDKEIYERPELQLKDLNLSGFEEKNITLLTYIKTQNDQIIRILNQKSTEGILKTDFMIPTQTLEQLEATEELHCLI